MGKVIRVSDSVGVMLTGGDDLPPTIHAEADPEGWQATGEVLDFNVGGEWIEAWVMER